MKNILLYKLKKDKKIKLTAISDKNISKKGGIPYRPIITSYFKMPIWFSKRPSVTNFPLPLDINYNTQYLTNLYWITTFVSPFLALELLRVYL